MKKHSDRIQPVRYHCAPPLTTFPVLGWSHLMCPRASTGQGIAALKGIKPLDSINSKCSTIFGLCSRLASLDKSFPCTLKQNYFVMQTWTLGSPVCASSSSGACTQCMYLSTLVLSL